MSVIDPKRFERKPYTIENTVKYAIYLYNLSCGLEDEEDLYIDIPFIVSDDYNIHLVELKDSLEGYNHSTDIELLELELHLTRLFKHMLGVNLTYHKDDQDTKTKFIGNTRYCPKELKGKLYI